MKETPKSEASLFLMADAGNILHDEIVTNSCNETLPEPQDLSPKSYVKLFNKILKSL